MCQLNGSWMKQLWDEFEKAYMKSIFSQLEQEKKAGETIYPAEDNVFNAFNTTAFGDVKVVILGQDSTKSAR